MKKIVALLMALIMLLSAGGALADNVRAADDFYAAINRTVLEAHDPDKGNGSWNWFFDLLEKVYEDEKAIIQDAAARLSDAKNPPAAGSSEEKLASLYMMAMDQEGRDADGLKDFNRLMKPAMEAKSVQEWAEALAELQYRYGFDAPVNTEVVAQDDNPGEYTVQVNPLNLSVDPEEFTYEDAGEDILYYFDDYLSWLLVIAGVPHQEAHQAGRDLFAFDKAISLSRSENKYGSISVEELQKLVSNLDLNAYLGKLYRTMPKEVFIAETGSLAKLNEYLTEEHLPMLKRYAYVINLDKFACYLSTQTRDAWRDMQESFVGDVDPLDPEKDAVKQVAELLKWDLGLLYTRRNFSEQEQVAVQKMVGRMLKEYEEMLREEDWLSQQTREKAVRKLEGIQLRIGLPENVDRYLSAYQPVPREQGGSYFSNVLSIRGENSQRQYDLFGQKVDRSLWNILPQDMTPCYYPTDNSINIPVAVLEKPYFSVESSDEANLGAIGTIIAHEISHAFDDLGSKYDENGDFVDWWTADDRKSFDERAERIVLYYTGYHTPGVMRQDGRQTLGENIADLGGMHCLSRIVEEDQLDAKAFFESYANAWASTADGFSEAIMAGMDEHAADKVRVNAVLGSCELFYKTYGIQEGDKMFIAPEDRVALW